MTNKKIVLGIAAGVVAGILLSPDKGSATRRKISDKTGELGNALKDCLLDFIKGKKTAAETAGSNENVTGASLNTMGQHIS